jgi:matrixin/PEP-CTERM motif-containing protein
MTRLAVLYLCRACWVVAVLLAASPTAHADPIGWSQPHGRGTPVYLTYSYSNLLDPGFNTVLSAAELRVATENAFGLWARYAPIHLFEVHDTGPLPSEHEYSPELTADIRIGFEPRLPNSDVAHTHVPYGRQGFRPTGLGGDIHFSNDLSVFDKEQWGHVQDALSLDFFSTMLHEAGHALGLLHMVGVPSVMGGELHLFRQPVTAALFPADIAAIRALYGAGRGGVHPLGERPPAPDPEPATMLLLAAGAGAILLRRRASGSVAEARPQGRSASRRRVDSEPRTPHHNRVEG